MPRRYSKRRRYRNRNRSLASKAYSLAKKAYQAPELKYRQLTQSNAPITGGTVKDWSTISQGTSNNTRIGDSIKPTSLHLRGSIQLNAGATETLVRVLVFRYISGAPTAVTDVLETADITSYKAEDKRYQSQVLFDRVYSINTDKPEMFFRKKIKLYHKIGYAQTLSPANRNSIHMLMVCNTPTAAPVTNIVGRLFYTDS